MYSTLVGYLSTSTFDEFRRINGIHSYFKHETNNVVALKLIDAMDLHVCLSILMILFEDP